ncbi:MAG: nucleoside hydrolase [Acidimicrobiia bacterium]
MRIWIDTDVGTNPDDAVALFCAVAHPGVELAGVSTVGADVLWRAEVACRLVPEEVAVVAGAAAAVAAIPAAGPDLVLGIGPLTNLAALAGTGWRAPRTVVMGGALAPVQHRGGLRRVESNFGADPGAAAVVLAHPGVTVVPLDATVATRVDAVMLGRLLAAAPELVPTVELWLAGLAETGVPAGEEAVHLHDPAALLVAVGEGVGRLEARVLVVDGNGALREDQGGVAHDVVVGLDGPGVVRRVVALLRGR